MMKKIVFTLLLSCIASIGLLYSQEKNERIEALKVAYITKQLQLTSQEAEKFWPVYKDYFNELKQAKSVYGNDEVAFEEKKVQIRKKYQGQFKSVLNSDNRVNRVFVSEKNLRDLFKKELQDRQRRRKLIGTQPQKSPKTNVKPPRKVN